MSKLIRRLFYIGSMQMPEDRAQNPWASEAMNVTQLALMEAFQTCGVQEVIGLSLPGSSAWHSTPRFKRFKRSILKPNIEIQELPFVALGPLQPLSQLLSYFWKLMTTSPLDRPDCIIITNPITRLSLLSFLIGNVWKKPIIVIVSDLSPTIYMGNLILYFRQWLQRKMVQIAPGVVVFSNHVGRELRPDRPWIRMVRPPAQDLLDKLPNQADPNERIIYFASTTAKISGTDLLLSAIHLIKDPRYRFWFSGRGPLDNTIREASHRDNRIIHWGFVSREKYRQLLQEANILVNPRLSSFPEHRYNFPSKLMEYMAVGRPIISTATSDVGEYYRDAIVLLEDETPKGLAKAIVDTCELPFDKQVELGARARQHVEHETWELQAQRILDFAQSLQR